MPRFVARLLVIAAALCGGVVAAAAQAYPSKPITLVCGQPPGSGPDIMSRLFAEIIGRSLGQRVLVLNRTGSGGIVAASSVAQAPPDGYTLLLVLNGTHTTVPAMQTMPFDPIKDFEFISLLYSSSGVLLVPTKSSAQTMSDFLTYARSKPGGISYGSPAIGSPAHLMGALLSESTGIPMTHVGYRGGSQIVIDLGAGMLDMTFTSSVQALPLIAQGQVRPLAVASETRLTQLPNVPTLKELGLGNVSVESWFGIAAPKGTPAGIVARLNAELVKAAQDPLIVKHAEQDGVTLRTGPQEEIVKLLAVDYERLGGAVKRLQIKAE
jgi:tripartite-type tricarboxylate transporter receptor subunit TctC